MKRQFWMRALKFAPLGLLLIAVFGFVVMSLWNWLMPDLFGLPSIGYWQAWGLIALSKILFGGFRGGGPRVGSWRHRMMERCEQMTPEEREKFRQAFQGRWGRMDPPDSKQPA